MKIVMDFRKYDGVVGGVEQAVIEITSHIAKKGHRVIILPKQGRLDEVRHLFKGKENIEFVPLNVPTHVMSLRNAYMDSVVIPAIAREKGANVIHFPYNWSFPFRKIVPTVLTIHDVIPFTFREAQSYFFNAFKYKPGIRRACNLNDVIATISEFSKKDIVRKVGVPESKIQVIPNGMRAPYPPNPALLAKLKKRFELEDGFVLNVGGIHERKNIVRLIRAFAILVKGHHFPGKLLITGSVSGAPYQEKMKARCDAAVNESGLEERIIFTGYVTDEELDTLMRMALFLIYPSLYEGFGIPVLEAMQVGTPVITSDVTAMPEVTGDAALLVDPLNENEIASAMAKLLSHKTTRNELIRKGYERVKLFSWEKTADQYLELYQNLAKLNTKSSEV